MLGVGLAIAFAASFLVAGIRAPDYQRAWALFPLLGMAAFPRAALLGPLAVGAWLAIFRALASWLASETKRSWIATLSVGLLPAAGLGWLVNRELLPGFWEPTSLIANAVLSLAFLAVGLLLARALVAWHRRTLAADAAPLLDLGAIIVVMLAGLFLYKSIRKPSGPHVFVLLIDVLRADHLSCYGYERATSPHIDRFAEDAILFEQAISSSTFTKTSVSSLFTGLAPHHHGVYVGNLRDSADRITSDVLSRDLTVMAEEMKRCGFVTLGIVHNGQLRPYMGFDQGFDLYDNDPGRMPWMVTRFRSERGRWPRSQRLFSYLHFLDLHGPYCPIPPYDKMFGRYSDSFDSIDLHETWQRYVADVKLKRIMPTEADIEQLRSLYDGQLVFVDEWIGRVLDGLKADGLYDESLIVLTGDHGDAFWEHGFINHSNMPYEELVHVPLVIKLPGSRNGGTRVKTPVGLVDILPTLLDLAGETGTGLHDGASLLGMLENPTGEHPPRGVHVSEFEASAAIREGNWKLLFRPHRPLELYDLERDPQEQTNLYEEEPEIARRLEQRLEAVLEARHQVSGRERVVVDPETVRELEALGY